MGVPKIYKVPLVLAPQPEGGFTVTSPLLTELVTEGDTRRWKTFGTLSKLPLRHMRIWDGLYQKLAF